MSTTSQSLSATPVAGAPDVPVHVAIIMDGNGRWARSRGLPRVEGHRRGADSARAVIKAAAKAGVKYLTLFGFSSENWKRPEGEVSDLMGLLRLYLRKELASLHKQGVRFRVIGDRTRLPEDVQDMIRAAEERTAANTGLNLVLALSYGGRAEITAAAKALAIKVRDEGLDPETIDEDTFAAHLETADIPEPDLLVRTSGEQRISNFLLWQCAYTEFVFTDTLWPDFGAEAFDGAIADFRSRERRFGAVGG